MKKFLLIIFLIPVLTFAQNRKQKKADLITLNNLKAHIEYLASDKLEGRRTGTPGEILAMQYISAQFQKDGLEPKGTNGFVQEFTIDEGKQFDSAINFFSVNDNYLKVGQDFFPLAFSANKSLKGSSSLSLREKGSIWFWDLKDILDDNKQNPHFDIFDAINTEVKNDASRGATALIIFNSSSLVDNVQFNKRDSSAVSIPVIYISQNTMQKYFNDATAFYNISLQVQLTNKSRKAHNVVGFINNNAPTTIVLGAHYDHLGYGEDGNSLDGVGQIHNGADDNASGTAALIELGRILKTDNNAKKNNYLFIAFSGEELGLFGSKYWLAHPTINANIDYMINMDMVGRYDSSRKLIIGGYGTSPTWGNIFQTTTDKNLVVHFDSSGLGPSDHASFYRDNIPVLFFFTNTHSDYHKATDDWQKINFSGEVEIVDYINKIIDATNNSGKLAFTQTRDREEKPISLPVTLGVMPDYSFTGTGLRIDGVSKGKTAERIGLQAGDVLLQLGDYKFVDIQTYMQALQKFKRGDKTTLRIKRGDKEMQFDVQF